ncbi:MAG TPA: hypothetical protein VH134_18310 [Candidatus Dormibacteraeota bacterium]|jgi:hypothetical protein|nr:hypothetical protein [Candidatus Dormibacteraeota bacterium]
MEIVFLVMLVVLAALAPRWGHDTRDGRDWQARTDWQEREELGRARARAATR